MHLTRITGIAALASTLLATVASIALLLPLHAKAADDGRAAARAGSAPVVACIEPAAPV